MEQAIPHVFIIESNSMADEKRGLSEGVILREVLRMMRKEVEYRYIRTTKELAKMAEQFADSNFRYLHMACHGNKGAFRLTFDRVPYQDFADIIGPVLNDRRLFLSACDIAHPQLARMIYESYRPYSITGPTCDIHFSDAAVVWSSLYRLLFKTDARAISGERLRSHLNNLCRLHDVEFSHFGRTPGGHFRSYHFEGEE